MSTIVFGGLTGLALGLAMQAAGLTDSQRVRDALALKHFGMLKTLLSFLGFGALMTALLGWLAVLDVDLLTVHPLSLLTVLGGVLVGVALWLCGLLPGTALGSMGGGRFWEGLCAVAGCFVGALVLPFVMSWTQPLSAMTWSQATLFRVTLDSPYLLPGGFLGLGIFGFVLLALAAYVPTPRVEQEEPLDEAHDEPEEHEFIPVLLPGMGSMQADAIDPAVLDDEIFALDALEDEPEEIDGDVEDEKIEEPILTDHPDLDPKPEEEDMTEALVEMEERAGIGTYVSEEAMPANARVLVKPDAEAVGAVEEEKEESREPVGKA